MSRSEKRLYDIRDNPDDVRFDELCSCAAQFGFVEAKGDGSHRIYRHPGPPPEMVNFQKRKDGKAKGYQVKQFLQALAKLRPDLDL